MQANQYQELIDRIQLEIEQESFSLPTLPSVAVNIQKILDNPNVSAEQIVAVLAIDPSVSAQIIKAANSALYAGKPQIDSTRDAALRLGYRRLHNLVITITMNKMLASINPVINNRMKQV
jgi:HD-like signal output (HDOD) protein